MQVILRERRALVVPLSSADRGAAGRFALAANDDADRAEAEADRAEVARAGSEAAQEAIIDAIDGVVLTNATIAVATRPLLAALDHALPAYLSEPGREGVFVWRAGDYTALVALDGLQTSGAGQGYYVADDADPTGATGAWVRQITSLDIHASLFGASPSASAAVNTDAFAAASARLNYLSGGKLITAPGEYVSGVQTLAGATGAGHAYIGQLGIISVIDCARSVELVGVGVTFKNPDGYRFGAFGPVTGSAVPDSSDPDTISTLVWGQIYLLNNLAPVKVAGFELDGNTDNLLLGGKYPDASGWQMPGHGIWAYGNASLQISDVYSHHHPTDGLVIGWTGIVATGAEKPVKLDHVISEYNGRQALSWVGGVGFLAMNSRFAHTGKNGTLSSAPGAGVDIEAEAAAIRRGLFFNCEFIDNTGPGLLANDGDVADCDFVHCLFVGTTHYSAWPNKPGFRFDDCTFVGAFTNPYASADPALAARFRRCLFTAELARSPTGTVYLDGTYLVNTGGTDQNVIFDDCDVDTGGNMAARMVFSANAIWRDSRFTQDANLDSYIRGRFEGYNQVTTAGYNDFNWPPSSNYGRLTYIYSGGTLELERVIPSDVRLGQGKSLFVFGSATARVQYGYVGPHYVIEALDPGVAFKPLKINGSAVTLQWNGVDTLEATELGADLKAAYMGYHIAGLKLIGPRGVAIANPSGGAVVDTECRTALISFMNACRAGVGTHGLIEA